MKGTRHSVATSETCPHCRARGFYVFARDRNWAEPCDSCGEEVRYTGDTESRSPVSCVVPRSFSGSQRVSITHNFAKTEVREARRQYADLQHCIHDTGRVVFRTRAEERSFAKRTRELDSAPVATSAVDNAD